MLYAVARALRLGEAESTHLFDLVRAATTRIDRSRTPAHPVPAVRDGVQDLLDSMVTAPAVVLSGHLDVVAANALGPALHPPLFARTRGTPNLARFVFFDAAADRVFPEWDVAADDAVSLLQGEAARSPDSPAVTRLVGELATQRRLPPALGGAQRQGAPPRRQAVPARGRR